MESPAWRGFWLGGSSLFIALCLAACGRGEQDALPPKDFGTRTLETSPSARESFAEEIRRVQAGESSAISLLATEVHDADLKTLETLTHLRSLRLDRANVTDAGMASIAGLLELESLVLRGSEIGDGGLARLKGLTRLKRLNLDSPRITNAGLESILELKCLELLRLENAQIDDEGLKTLAKLTELRQLLLAGTRVTDDGLQSALAIPKLESLYLERTLVSDEGVAKLLGQRPGLHVHY